MSTKNTKLVGCGGARLFVIPSTRKAEAGESLEPGRWRLQWPEIVPLPFSLGNRNETPSQRKRTVLKPEPSIKQQEGVLREL